MKNLIIIAIITITLSCNVSDIKRLKKIREYKIDVKEPSGLAITSDGKYLFTVSDEKNKVYKLSLNGKVLNEFKVDGKDLEGITMLNDSTLAIVLETKREIMIYSDDGNKLRRIKLKIKGDSKFGLEGISFNPNNGHTFLINGEQPRKLFELDDNYKIIYSRKLSFASDFSGLFYDAEADLLWILSDESSTLTKCDIKGNVIQKYIVNIPKPEGVAIDTENKLVYVVSDSKEKLYMFKFDD